MDAHVERFWERGWYGRDAEHNPTVSGPDAASKLDDDKEPGPAVVWIRYPQEFHLDDARVEVDHSSLDVGKSSCMLSLFIEPDAERCMC